MEIHYLENKAIDRDKWDYCIAKSFNGLVYAYSWYLDAVCSDWNALVQGDYIRVFPLPVKRKFGVSLIYQPFFTQQLGLFSRDVLNEMILKEFLQEIPKKYKYVEIYLNTYNKINPQIFRQTQFINLELDLINSYENIRKNYSKNLIRNLKRATNNNLSLVKNLKPDEVIKLFTENKEKSIKHLKKNDYLKFKRLIYSSVYKGMTDVYGVYTSRNELCAGAIFIRSHNRVSFIFSGINKIGKDSSAMPILINQYIKDHSQRHLTFNFEGSNNKQLAQFYKSFGAQKVYYSQIVLNRLSIIQNILFLTYRKIKSLI